MQMCFVITPALTPALSPRKGRILRRVWRDRQPSFLQSFSLANNQRAATGNPTPKFSQRVRLPFPLPGGEGQGEGERKTNFKFKGTSNIEHRTPNTEPFRTPARSTFDVQCSMFDVSPF